VIKIYISVQKDLSKIQPRLVFGLTKRQLVCFGSAAAIGVPFYFLTRNALGNSVSVLLMIALMLPLFFLAMYQHDGVPAEKILLYIARKTLWPAKRPYRTENLYDYITKEAKIYRSEQNGKGSAPD
jgi:hypothetical protein